MAPSAWRSKAFWLAMAVVILPLAAVLLAWLYLMVRTAILIVSDYGWLERLIAAILLLGEWLLLLHGAAYFLNIFRVIRQDKGLVRRSRPVPPPVLSDPPALAVVVASYHEPLDILRETLACLHNLRYANKQLYLLDDTRYDQGEPAERASYRQEIQQLCQMFGVHLFRRPWRGAKAGIINDFLAHCCRNEPVANAQLTLQDGRLTPQTPVYLAVFDADQNPFPQFAAALVAWLEAEPRLAFVQTPQYYTNFQTSLVAKAAGLQQAVFYEYICEGKSSQNAMFCCGTNVVFRVQALLEVGGFDENSVTEDFATSLRLHQHGWQSAYHPEALTFGLGPEDLGGYFKQQFRWALGTVGMLRRVLGTFWRNPHKLAPAVRWEYLISSSYYLVGFVFGIMVVCPILYLFTRLPSYFAWPGIYLLFFLPYFTVSAIAFFGTLRARNYRARDLLLGQAMIFLSFPIYIKAAVQGLLNVRGHFQVTPKGASSQLPLRDIWPQMLGLTACYAAVVWGANRLIFEPQQRWTVAVNMFWCLYHFGLFATMFLFNAPNRQGKLADANLSQGK